jgi:hypothetical protein
VKRYCNGAPPQWRHAPPTRRNLPEEADMTQPLHHTRRLPRGWFQFAQTLIQAPRRRRPEFALTEPVVFRSECFAEDLPAAPGPAAVHRPLGAGWLAAAPLGVALLGAASSLLGPLA